MKLLFVKNRGKKAAVTQAGFTLVETLVAVAIFSISITAVISTVASGVASTIATKNRITANYLVQEELEYIRHVRNKYSPAVGVAQNWNSFLDSILVCDGALCVIADPTDTDPTPEFIACGDQNRCVDYPVSVDALSGYFSQPYSPSPNTPFRRFFTIQQIGTDEITITASVYWQEKNTGEKNITLTENLTNWLPN